MINLPKKYRGDGRHLYCYKCKKPVTSDWDKDPNGKYIKEIRCSHKEDVVFYSIPYSKIHGKNVVRKAWPKIKSYEEFFNEHNLWHEKQKVHNYGMVIKVAQEKPFLLLDCINYYLDWLNNVPNIVPRQKRVIRTAKHIGTVRKHLQTFADSLRKNGVNPSSQHVNVPDEFVGYFYSELESIGYANKTFNHYISSVRVFYKVMIELKITGENPFVGITRKYTFNDPQIISMEEFSNLIVVTKKENGWGRKVGQKRNFFRDWLVKSWYLALFTGERRDGVFELKWKHVEGGYFKIPNFKINEIQKVNVYHWVLITKDFAIFLAGLKAGEPDDYIIDTEDMNRNTAKEFCTQAFTHFWNISSNEIKKDFKNLRKTQKTRETILMGEQRKYLKSGTVDVERDHYIGQREIQEKFKDELMFPELGINNV